MTMTLLYQSNGVSIKVTRVETFSNVSDIEIKWDSGYSSEAWIRLLFTLIPAAKEGVLRLRALSVPSTPNTPGNR